MKKIYDVVATTGSYQKDGEKKYLNDNVGTILQGDYGPVLKLKASFNPAGLKIGDDGLVWLKLFEEKKKEQPQAQKQQSSQQQKAPDFEFDDSIPFN